MCSGRAKMRCEASRAGGRALRTFRSGERPHVCSRPHVTYEKNCISKEREREKDKERDQKIKKHAENLLKMDKLYLSLMHSNQCRIATHSTLFFCKDNINCRPICFCCVCKFKKVGRFATFIKHQKAESVPALKGQSPLDP